MTDNSNCPLQRFRIRAMRSRFSLGQVLASKSKSGSHLNCLPMGACLSPLKAKRELSQTNQTKSMGLLVHCLLVAAGLMLAGCSAPDQRAELAEVKEKLEKTEARLRVIEEAVILNGERLSQVAELAAQANTAQAQRISELERRQP